MMRQRKFENPDDITFFEELAALSIREYFIIGIVSLALIWFVEWDVHGDIVQGNSITHITIDLFFGAAALLSVILLGARFGRQHIRNYALAEQAVLWKARAENLQSGISSEIDKAMGQWHLSEAEKEIGLLLLKGLSIREISELRGTSERTVRQQSLSIYSKAGIAGRAELSAFFMEDFLDRKENGAGRNQNSAKAHFPRELLT